MLPHKRCRPAPALWRERPLPQHRIGASHVYSAVGSQAPAASAGTGTKQQFRTSFVSTPTECLYTRWSSISWHGSTHLPKGSYSRAGEFEMLEPPRDCPINTDTA